MKRVLTPILFFAFLHLTRAQVTDQDVPRTARDQVIPDDLIVQGSECVGLDCVNNENFGFMTLILKENNTRLKFFDTSAGTFPGNDWILEANESASGGRNHFAIVDETGAKVPFKIIAGAPTNSLFVDNTGRVGIGTGNPVLRVHAAHGDSPGLRLEQTNASGFAPQTWDIAGNETNFFVRDATNGSRLPFKIQPGAATNSLVVANDGNVGIGTLNPQRELHVSRTTGRSQILIETTDPGGAVQLRMKTDLANNRRIVALNSEDVVQSQIALEGGGTFKFYPETAATFSQLVAGQMALTASSSRALKNNIKKFEVPNILDRISSVPVSTYNWKRESVGEDMSQHEVLGLIAQDFFKVLERGKDTEINGQDVMMALWMGVQDLNKKDQEVESIIESKDIRISELEFQVNELRAKLDEISDLLSTNYQDIILNGGDRAILGQNYPNPYEDNTMIDYYIPGDASSAEIRFTDVEGKIVKQMIVKSFGKGQIKLKAQDLPVGNYFYSLIVNGELTSTKQMVLIR